MRIPAVALRGLTVLPGMVIHFDVSRKKSVAAVERAMIEDQQLFMITQREEDCEDPVLEDLYTMGTVGTIKQILRLPGDVIRVLAEGQERADLLSIREEEGFLMADVEQNPVEITPFTIIEKEAMIRALKSEILAYGEKEKNFGKTAARQINSCETLEEMLRQLMIRFPADTAERQSFLMLDSTHMQFVTLMEKIERNMEAVRLKQEIQEKVKARVDKNQREYLIREEIKVLREELGEDNPDQEEEELRKKTAALTASEEVKAQIFKEIKRLHMMPPGSQEAVVLRTYIDTVLELPWDKTAEESCDIRKAEKILNDDHYGLEDVKERVLEHLAVRNFSGNNGGTIMCLVGPPGTGKTSIARSVARALNRPYVRVCLGGVHDEAEIRGHRRTYVGSMPGRIADGMKKAGVSNPLMLLDEIDKVSSDYKGDVSSAMLEVLDSEQNSHFADHYVEIPMDLSRVLFIATANTTQTIPKPLLDRMEVIEISGYTENEKYHIARSYLVDKQREACGLGKNQLRITDGALRRIIHNYTREAGVRNLERKIGTICRKTARKLLEDNTEAITVKAKQLETYLGKEKVQYDMANTEDQAGIVRGLAWTSVGGDTLEIEVNIIPGKNHLQLTGQMGDVMKESAMIGLSYVRSVAADYNIDEDYFENHEIHMHIPEGAVPKDGPSAGITMATAMLSAVTGGKVYADLAMTGEVTLRGRVLPIGGLKEKLLAAKMADIHHVLVPAKNRVDVEELSKEITDGLEIIYVTSMNEVIQRSLV